jgi:hypothetical protein
LGEPQTPFYDLEFTGKVDFWAGSDASSRRVFLMPVSTPSDFLALGVHRPSSQVHFAAWGQLQDHLGDFIAWMARAETTVELYVRPPLAAGILKRYLAGPPIEGTEYEEPPEPPVLGFTSTSATPYEEWGDTPLWTEGDASSRRLLLTPTSSPAEFLAFGLLEPAETALFTFRGSVRDHLGELIARAVRDAAPVELHPRFPVP